MLIRMTLSNLTVHYAKTEDLIFAGGGMLNAWSVGGDVLEYPKNARF